MSWRYVFDGDELDWEFLYEAREHAWNGGYHFLVWNSRVYWLQNIDEEIVGFDTGLREENLV